MLKQHDHKRSYICFHGSECSRHVERQRDSSPDVCKVRYLPLQLILSESRKGIMFPQFENRNGFFVYVKGNCGRMNIFARRIPILHFHIVVDLFMSIADMRHYPLDDRLRVFSLGI